MATTKKSSTSKTARVMNLLSKNREEPTPEIETSEAQIKETSPAPAAEPAPAPVAQAPAAPVAAHSTTPPIISSMQADSVISDQVFNALESALDSELGTSAKEDPAPAVEPAAEPAPAPVATQEPIAEPEPVPAPAVEPVAASAPIEQPAHEPVPAPVAVAEPVSEPVPEPAAAPAAEPAQPVPEPSAESRLPTRVYIDSDTVYVNVMEKLVEEKAMKYIEMFGLCQCKRCIADVKALALNRLDPKYVVMRVGEEIPRISLYEGKFSPSVTAQLLSACKTVMERPHHNRD